MIITKLLESLNPTPLNSNIFDALDHVSYLGDFKRSDFILKYEGLLSVDELGRYDDLSSWVEIDTEDELETYRSGSFNKPKHEVPPIIVITVPHEEQCITQIGDGRGRVNYAKVHNMKLHVWHLIHKQCQ